MYRWSRYVVYLHSIYVVRSTVIYYKGCFHLFIYLSLTSHRELHAEVHSSLCVMIAARPAMEIWEPKRSTSTCKMIRKVKMVQELAYSPGIAKGKL
jgi:hypothetical protein